MIQDGIEIPTAGGYADQPSIVLLSDGTFVCATTTGTGEEGAAGQYVSIMRSLDGGKTWSEGTPVEDLEWESAYAVFVADRFDRIYCLYKAKTGSVKKTDPVFFSAAVSLTR